MAQGGIMTSFRWVHIMKSIIDILKKANCSFSYNYQTMRITTIGGEDITPHLFSVFETIDKIEDEYWNSNDTDETIETLTKTFISKLEQKENL